MSKNKTQKEIAYDKFVKWRKHPETFFTEVLGITTLEDYQINLLNAVANNQKVTVKACHSVGKTWTMARIALWFFACFKNSIVITTAPTYNQVEALLWGELRDAFKKSKYPIGGHLTTTRLKKSDKHYCMGFSPQKKAGVSDEQQGSTFQGFHSDYVMVVFDEAVGISADVWKMSSGLMTSGKMVKFVAIANPTTKACEFYNTFESFTYKKIHLSCFNSPNLKANNFFNKEDIQDEMDRLTMLKEDDRLHALASYQQPTPHLASASWVVEYCMEWGITHPLVVSKVFGEFPDDDDSVLVPMSLVQAAFERNLDIDDKELRCIGVDVARYGSDKSVLCEMVGLKQTDLLAVAKRSTTVVTGHVINMINNDYKLRNTVVLVDSTGIGAGVFDNLVEKQQEGIIDKKVQLMEIHFGASPVNEDEKDQEIIDQDKSRYANLKARMYQLLSNDMRHCIDLINDSNFMKELPTIKSFPDSKGRLRIESKEDYKKRTGRPSPDYSDALALCNLGRYVNITYRSFNKNISSAPMVKQKKRKERRSGVKVSEY